MTISTRGNDTITMANVLQALNNIINSIQEEKPQTEAIEPEVVNG